MTDSKTKPQPRLVLLAAGGTGGHMFPAQALARELIARGVKVTLLTDQRGGGFGPELAQVETYRVAAAGLAGGDFFRRSLGILRLGLGYLQARALIGRLKPDVVVGFGGYASVPGVLAAAHRKVKVVLHEQNQVMGRANRMLAPRAAIIATSFPQVEGLSPFLIDRVEITGNPVRASIAAIGRQPYALAGASDRLRLLVTGGSQGARVFNEIVPAAIALLPEPLRLRLLVSQQVRGNAVPAVEDSYRASGVRAELAAFFDDIPERLRSAHLVICRSGASTVAELAAAGRPAILVPYPFAADDHQSGNAQAFSDAGGGWLIPQSALSAESLAARLEELLQNPGTLARAASCARAFCREKAAERLADLVCGGLPDNGHRKEEGVAA